MIKEFFSKLWNDEEGAETVEYVVIAAILAGIGVVVYQSGALKTTLNTGVTKIGNIIGGIQES